MLQPRERTGRAGRGPGRGGEPRELPVQSRDAAAVYPHRTAPWLQLRGWGTPGHLSAPEFQGRSRPRTRVGARLRATGGPGRPETRGASRIPGGFPHPGAVVLSTRGDPAAVSLADGGTESASPYGQPPAQPLAPGSAQSPQSPRVPGIPHQPRTDTGKRRCHPHTPGTDHRESGQPRPAEPAPLRHPGSAERNFGGRELTVRCGGARCGAVRDRCGTGAGAAAAPAPPGSRAAAPRSPAHYPQAPPLPRQAPPPSAVRPAPSAVLGAGSPQRTAGLRAASCQTPQPRSSVRAGRSQEPSVQPRGAAGGRKVGITLGAWAGRVPVPTG